MVARWLNMAIASKFASSARDNAAPLDHHSMLRSHAAPCKLDQASGCESRPGRRRSAGEQAPVSGRDAWG
jgi:hypothetical protein